MRLRNITGSREFIAENEFVVHEPEQYKGKWHELFGNRNPIHIEIGQELGDSCRVPLSADSTVPQAHTPPSHLPPL